MYQITNYTQNQAKKLNVIVKPSTRKGRKIDVIKNNVVIASIGDMNYSDYPTYIKSHGLEYANNRRKPYKSRHEKDRHVVDSTGYYADKLLW